MNTGLSAKELHQIALQHAQSIPFCATREGKRLALQSMFDAHRQAFRQWADKRGKK